MHRLDQVAHSSLKEGWNTTKNTASAVLKKVLDKKKNCWDLTSVA
jgi:hypothetical protein